MKNFNTSKFLFFTICACILPAYAACSKRQVSNTCYTPDGNIGLCVILPNCPALVDLYGANRGSYQITQYIIASQRNCGTRRIGREPVVCCREAYMQATAAVIPTFQPEIMTAPPFTTTTVRRPDIMTAPTPTTDPLNSRLKRSDCNGPDGAPGTCIDLQSCRPYIERLQDDPNNAEYLQFLRRSNAICRQPTPIVCCPTGAQPPTPNTPPPIVTPNTVTTANPTGVSYTLPTPQEGCGVTNASARKIVGGGPAKIGAYPWAALIGYDDGFGGISWKCGGSLITRRHVVTAAHCINSQIRQVRLGEHDLNSNTEANHVDINVIKNVRHPKYDKRDGHSDIALLYLEREVQFSVAITPVCIPFSAALRNKSYVGFNPFVVGWGKTQEGGKSAEVLQELQIPVLRNDQCSSRYASKNRLISTKQFDAAVLCAGVLTGGKDSCQGDSGGPLTIAERVNGRFYHYLIGIVSYGIGCARVDVPGVYCRVQNFVDWIQERVAEPI